MTPEEEFAAAMAEYREVEESAGVSSHPQRTRGEFLRCLLGARRSSLPQLTLADVRLATRRLEWLSKCGSFKGMTPAEMRAWMDSYRAHPETPEERAASKRGQELLAARTW